jgi:hypothetical protein
MDELELLLDGLRSEAPPQASLDRIAPGVHRRLHRRRFIQFALATAASFAALAWALYPTQQPIPLPAPGRAIIAVPDLIFSAPAPAPTTLSLRRAKLKPHLVDEHTLQLASTDPNVVIYWSLE